MKKLIVGGLAALAIGLVIAPVAGASPITESEYIDTVQDYGWIMDDATAIRTGHVICSNLDSGVKIADIEAWLDYEFDNTHTQPGTANYYTDVFIQMAAQQYCPWTEPMDWNI